MVELPYNIAMIVGLPRSGTTLLQIALTEQPGIVTSHETHLFDVYVGPAFNRYNAEQRDLKSADGIRHHINSDALMANFRALAISILSSIHSKNPAARIVLEKTPGHLFYMPLIKQMLPTTRFIHIVRDPRGVAASLKAAARENWGAWAAGDIINDSRNWVHGINVGLDQSRKLGADYKQVQYEHLFVRGGEIIAELREWLGLPAAETLPADLRERFPIGGMVRSGADPTDPRNEDRERFFRRGEPSSWQEELTTLEIAQIEDIAGETMQRMGYFPCVVQMQTPV